MVKKLNGGDTVMDVSGHLIEGQYAILAVTGARSPVTLEFNHAGEVDAEGELLFYPHPQFPSNVDGTGTDPIVFEFATFTTRMRVRLDAAQGPTEGHEEDTNYPWYITILPLSMPEY